MKILIAVHNLIVEKSHLMPWRTVCEVVRYMQTDGHDAHLVSLGNKNGELQGNLIPLGTREIRKSPDQLISDLKRELERIEPDVIFWPMAWRESLKRIKIITSANVPVILWFPGGVYSIRACLHALKVMGGRKTLPYLLETMSNRKKMVSHFKKLGVKAILTMTKETANSAIEAGWPKTKTFIIPPGKENNLPNNTGSSLSTDFKKWLRNKPFYLFMGPPSGIRGIFELLKAFDIAAAQDQDIRLVCLFRSDGALDTKKVKKSISNCKNRGKIFTVWQSLQTDELNSFISACHAVTLPFILVPSEIPLAIIEAMAWGKPIISTSPGGTGAFVEHFGLSPKVGDCNQLADAIVKAYQDSTFYKEKCDNAIDYYTAHPDWRSVSTQWADIAKQITTARGL